MSEANPKPDDAAEIDFDEAFSSAFSEASEEAPPLEKPVKTAAPAVDDDDGDEDAEAAALDAVDDETGDDDQAADGGDDDADAGEVDAKPAKKAAKRPVAEDDDDDGLLNRLADLVRKTEPKGEAAKKPETQPQEQQIPAFSPEEQQAIDDYRNDFPEVAKAESLIRRSEYQQLVKYIFDEVTRGFAPYLQQVEVLANKAHMSDLYTAVEDYDDVRDKVIAWVDEQPEYLQTAFRHVIEEGTPAEVQDLIARWRAATGTPAQQANEQQPAEAELPEATKKAVASLAPVKSKRSVVPKSSNAEDFDSAFEQALKL